MTKLEDFRSRVEAIEENNGVYNFSFSLDDDPVSPDHAGEENSLSSDASFSVDFGPPYDLIDLKMRATTENLALKDGSILKIISKPGAGSSPSFGSKVSVRYRLFLDNLEEPLDSKFSKIVKTFEIGSNEVLMGLDIAVLSMKRHEQAVIILSPEVAFGSAGCTFAGIPPDSPIIVEVELVSISSCTAALECYEDPDFVTPASQHSFAEIVSRVADLIKELKLAVSEPKRVDEMYRRADSILSSCHLEGEEEEIEFRKYLKSLYDVVGLQFERNHSPAKLAKLCRRAVTDFPEESKFYYRWGKAIGRMSSKPEDFKHARFKLETAMKLSKDEHQMKKIQVALSKLTDQESLLLSTCAASE
ncbi:unnamed protein product [Notodromas monacha]|uniref:peptidylprolyl isomerase n=1 Tax=Notodromas monacha TaxID=399045 RepID=A0A7R9BPN3_9CRUS|nr:unnamed protein product [Notodromas monacha]CAG0919380.1 unnamed protein product [Notodromas monacha]